MNGEAHVPPGNRAIALGTGAVRLLLFGCIMWKPVLEGQLANDAAQAVRDVAVAVAATPEAVAPADRTLFWAYATSMVDEPFAHAAYDAALDDVIATLRTGVSTPSLYDGGLAGIGFTLSHVLDGGAEDVLQVIDEALIGVLAVDRWTDSLDLAQGVVGLGVYFLERLHNNPQASLPRDGLARVIHHLEHAAHRSDRGTTWLTTLEVMPEAYRARYPEGFHDCGVAHGVPGMIGFLARVQHAPRTIRRPRPCASMRRNGSRASAGHRMRPGASPRWCRRCRPMTTAASRDSGPTPAFKCRRTARHRAPRGATAIPASPLRRGTRALTSHARLPSIAPSAMPRRPACAIAGCAMAPPGAWAQCSAEIENTMGSAPSRARASTTLLGATVSEQPGAGSARSSLLTTSWIERFRNSAIAMHSQMTCSAGSRAETRTASVRPSRWRRRPRRRFRRAAAARDRVRPR